MVSIFITAFALVLGILLLAGIGFYFWQKSARDTSERVLPPNPDFHGLFGGQPAKGELRTQENLARAIIANRERQLSILNEQIRSEGLVGDKAAAVKAQEVGITAELTKQRALLDAIPAQRDTARILILLAGI